MKIVTTLMLAAVTVLVVPCAQADGVVAQAHVPFEFVVGDQSLPSGDYRFVQEQNGRLLRIYSADREAVATALWVPMSAPAEESGRLVFHRYGDQRFLRKISTRDGRGASLPETKAERDAGETIEVETL